MQLGQKVPIIFFVILPAISTVTGFIFLFMFDIGVIIRDVIDTLLVISLAILVGLFYYPLVRPSYIEKCLKQGLEQAVVELTR